MRYSLSSFFKQLFYRQINTRRDFCVSFGRQSIMQQPRQKTTTISHTAQPMFFFPNKSRKSFRSFKLRPFPSFSMTWQSNHGPSFAHELATISFNHIVNDTERYKRWRFFFCCHYHRNRDDTRSFSFPSTELLKEDLILATYVNLLDEAPSKECWIVIEKAAPACTVPAAIKKVIAIRVQIKYNILNERESKANAVSCWSFGRTQKGSLSLGRSFICATAVSFQELSSHATA